MTLYSIDYDEKAGSFQALFCHGTSSESLPGILQNGIVRPDYEVVAELVMATAPHLSQHLHLIEGVADGPLGITARRREQDVEFATWFGNRAGAKNLIDEISRVVRHGGEVFAETWRALSIKAAEYDFDPPAARFPNATARVVLFRVPFELCTRFEVQPRTFGNFIKELSWSVFDDELGAYKILTEVKFLDQLPPNMIVWHGEPEDALTLIEEELVSPLALQHMQKADPFLGLERESYRPCY